MGSNGNQIACRSGFEVAGFEFAIYIENDLTLAPDFLWYFRLTAPLLERDPSLWCVSAWNDNGFRELQPDERRLFRTDYFPGLGWMTRDLAWIAVQVIFARPVGTIWNNDS